MWDNLEQLQSCFVSLHSDLKVQVKSLEQDLLQIHPMGKYLREGFLLPGRLQTFWMQTEDVCQGSALWWHLGCLWNLKLLLLQLQKEQAGVWGLSGNEHGRNNMGALSCVSSPVLPSQHCVICWPHRGVQPGAQPSVNGRGTAGAPVFSYLKWGVMFPPLVREDLHGSVVRTVGHRVTCCCWVSGLQQGERAAACPRVATAETEQGLWHSGVGIFFVFKM